MRRACLLGLAAALIATLGAGCGSPGTRVGAATDPTPPSTQSPTVTSLPAGTDRPGRVVVECTFPSINLIVTGSDAAVLGTVTAVSEPRWNSADNQPWTRQPGGMGDPQRGRDVTVHVTDVLFDSAALPVHADQDVTIKFLGDGSHSGIPGCSFPGSRFNDSDGPVAAGDHVLYLLDTSQYGTKEGLQPAVYLAGGSVGNWVLDDRGVANNADPERTVPAGPLIDRIRAERARGRQPETEAQANDTARNPLGGSHPYPDPNG